MQAPECPWCEPGKCKLAPHGFYPRVKPKGTWVRRFRCPRTKRTVSLLPDCFAAWVKGTLEELEEEVRAGEGAARPEEAEGVPEEGEEPRVPEEGCREAKGEGGLQVAVEWVRGLLVTVRTLDPERFGGVEPSLAGFGQRLRSQWVLRTLRGEAEAHLGSLPAPLGFRRVRETMQLALPRANKQTVGPLEPPGRALQPP